jgi:hypothetical protein
VWLVFATILHLPLSTAVHTPLFQILLENARAAMPQARSYYNNYLREYALLLPLDRDGSDDHSHQVALIHRVYAHPHNIRAHLFYHSQNTAVVQEDIYQHPFAPDTRPYSLSKRGIVQMFQGIFLLMNKLLVHYSCRLQLFHHNII